jgi:hypothetical protein
MHRPSAIAVTAGFLVGTYPSFVTAEYIDPSLVQSIEGARLVEEKPVYDPLWGIDSNGRIPAIERPGGLSHPERWRYLPEGRLKPGNVLQRFLVSSFITPYAFSSSDVGTGVGLAITDLDFRRQRRREFAALLLSYTSKGQQEYRIKWRRWLHHIDLPEGGILQEERSFFESEVGFNRTLTHRFFGLGSGTDASDETSYSDESFYGELGLDRTFPSPGSDWVLHLSARGESHDLGSGHVEGSPSMDDVHPELFADAESRNMGWLRMGLRYDTRDSQQNPYEGWHLGGLAAWAPVQSGGDMGGRYTLSAGYVFRTLPLFHNGGDAWEENPPTDTLAFGFRNAYTSGDLPFFALPTLGGTERHRGYIGGRFRGNASWLSALEYRFWVLPRGVAFTRSIRIERIGIALFYEAGAVSEEVSPARLFQERVRHSYGASLRISFDRTNPLRFDFGFSEDGMEFSLGYGLTF